MKLPDVFTVVKKTDDEEVIWNEVKDVAQVALDRFVQMRETEGVKMYDDISGRLDYIEETVGKIEDQSPSVTESYRERLYAKIKETLGDKDIDEQRILTEVAIFADKVAIDEETVRLRSHISQFRGLIKSDEPVGRKLDFLVQELNREVNTIGSKANDLTITKMVVDLKAEIERSESRYRILNNKLRSSGKHDIVRLCERELHGHERRYNEPTDPCGIWKYCEYR